MSRERTFKTTILMEDARCFECEIPVKVTYSHSAGYAGDRINPPEDASVEISAIEAYGPEFGGVPIPDRFLTDEGLIAECFDHDEAEYEDAMERRADARRDDSLQDWLA